MKLLRTLVPIWTAIITGCASGSGSGALSKDEQRLAADDAALFGLMVRSLADSASVLREMIGIPNGGVRLAIEPRSLRVVARDGPDILSMLAAREIVELDSLDGRDRAARSAMIRAYGFDIGDLKALSKCPGGRVLPPGSTDTLPSACGVHPPVAGVGVVDRTTRDVVLRVLILAALPFKQQYSSNYTFVRGSEWRLTGKSLWMIAE